MSGILDTASKNAVETLTPFLESLGFADAEVVPQRPRVGAAHIEQR